jgi:hypothetical protein
MREQRIAQERRGIRPATRAAGLAVALAVAVPVLGFGAEPELPAFGMVGVARRQTAILNAVLTHAPNGDHPGCAVTMSFVDATGTVFRDRTGTEVKKRVVLRDNVADSLLLPAADVLGVFERRKSIRAAVVETPDPGAVSDCCALTLTLEIVGATGSTSELALPRAPNPPNPFCLLPR